jgi:disulfide bond formation protein DsbB
VGLAPFGRRLRPLFRAALALVFLGGCAVAVYHAGAEWKWWPGPTACSSGRGAVSVQALAALMHGAKIAAPRCDQAAWRGLGLSMAGWNALISLALAALSALAVVWKPEHERR